VDFFVKFSGEQDLTMITCEKRSMPSYEKVCYYLSYENITVEDSSIYNYDISECALTFIGEKCKSCEFVLTEYEYCYTDGNCTNGTFVCYNFDCTNTEGGQYMLSIQLVMMVDMIC
jgi:hypothetical protein